MARDYGKILRKKILIVAPTNHESGNGALNECIVLSVEYEPNTRGERLHKKTDQIYVCVGPRKSDGFTCLTIEPPQGGRRHNIYVGSVYAITIRGRRHVLETPWERWRIRAQEIVKLIVGHFTEDWAAEYFDPASPKYFKRTPDYEPQVDPEVERRIAGTPRVRAPTEPDTEGCSTYTVAFLIVVAIALFHFG